MYTLNLNTVFNYALISVGFSGYNDYLKTVNSRKAIHMARRHVLAWILVTKVRETTLKQVGDFLQKNHATVINSVNRVSDLLSVHDERTVNLVGKALGVLDELVRASLMEATETFHSQGVTDMKIVIGVIGDAVNGGMTINPEDSLNTVYAQALKFLTERDCEFRFEHLESSEWSSNLFRLPADAKRGTKFKSFTPPVHIPDSYVSFD